MVASPRALDAALVARVSVGHGIDAELGPLMSYEEYHPYGTTAWHADVARHQVEVLASKKAKDGFTLALGREAATVGL